MAYQPLPQNLSEAGFILAYEHFGDFSEHVAAVMLGREGGKSVTPAKQAAARVNGLLGGRPPGS